MGYRCVVAVQRCCSVCCCDLEGMASVFIRVEARAQKKFSEEDSKALPGT